MIDLDVSTPDDVPAILRRAADTYRESQAELEAAWQDASAGKIWGDYATILDRAAASMDRARQRRGL